MMPKQLLLGVGITVSSQKDIVSFVTSFLSSETSGQTLTIVTPNSEQLVLAQTDAHFRSLLTAADIALPDGSGVVYGLKMQNAECRMQNVQRVAGVDFFQDLCRVASERRTRVAFIGNESAKQAMNVLKARYPTLQGDVIEAPELQITNYKLQIIARTDEIVNIKKENENEFEKYVAGVAEMIVKKNVQMVFVGLGAPKQEYFIEVLSRVMSHVPASSMIASQGGSRALKPIVFMSVGGSFDMVSGRIARAPLWMRSMGLEWLYRLMKEPWRWRRQSALLQYIWLVVTHKHTV